MIIQFLKKQAANFITFSSMILGLFSILNSIEANYKISALFICIAAVLDYLDGLVARKLNTSSKFGKYLDSNSDLISFGVAPGLLIYLSVLSQFNWIGILVALLYISAGAFRLARFNAQEFSGNFVGIPITIAGLVLAIIYFLHPFLPSISILIISIVLSYLMVSKHSIKKI